METIFIQLVVALVLAYALRPEQKTPKPPSLDQIEGPMAEEGPSIPVIFGTVKLTQPNSVWHGDQKVQEFKVGSGGKK